jgi:hypothetical protein
MSNVLNILELRDKTVKLNYVDTRVIKIKKFEEKYANYKDFVIDGLSLSHAITSSEPNAPADTTLLRDDFDKNERIKYLKRLLGKLPTDLSSGRTSIYLCPIDGDNSCGVAACYIDFENEYVVWRDFVWDGDDGTEDNDAEEYDYEPVKGLSNYTFDRAAYEKVLEAELNPY